MRAGVARGTGRGGVLASSPSSNTGLHAASHIRCKMVGEATPSWARRARRSMSGVLTGTQPC
eukprot:scaffold13662_cov49-Phaeocystis_antarctica.AAC.2